MQVLAACVAHSLVIQVGINMSFSAVLLPQLRQNDSPINIDINQASWIGRLFLTVNNVTLPLAFS